MGRGFFDVLDQRSADARHKRLAERPSNLHNYQGCEKDQQARDVERLKEALHRFIVAEDFLMRCIEAAYPVGAQVIHQNQTAVVVEHGTRLSKIRVRYTRSGVTQWIDGRSSLLRRA